jgi:hypothetical protein
MKRAFINTVLSLENSTVKGVSQSDNEDKSHIRTLQTSGA